jgi:hypothetical protein
MDGINPTLALAALLFGLHGNPQETSSHSPIDAQVAERPACASVAGMNQPAQLPQEADSLVRRTVPAANSGITPDRCKPQR